MLQSLEVNGRQESPQSGSDNLAPWVRLAQSGDSEAFAILVKKCDRRVFRVAYSILQNREDAEDASQIIFLKAFEHLPKFEGRSTFATWIMRIGVNVCLMELRRRKKHLVSLDHQMNRDGEIKAMEVSDTGFSPEEICNQSELRKILCKALRELRPGLRIVFVLRDIDGMSTEETAAALKINVPVVKTRLLRARLALRRKLEGRWLHSRDVQPKTLGALAMM